MTGSRTRRAAAVTLAVALGALGGWEPFRTSDPDVEAGNRAYAEARYDDAIAAYDRAAQRGGVDAGGLAFDRGTAELKKSDAVTDPAEKRQLADRALDDLKQAGHAKDPRIRGAAHYNRGNLLLEQDKLADAIEAYKQALRESPNLEDARLNLELALRRTQHHQNQPPHSPPPQGQPDPQRGSGSNQQGSNQPNGAGSNQQGSNQPNGAGSNQPNGAGSNGQGSNQPNGQGSDQPSGAGSNQPSGARSNQPQNGPVGPPGNGHQLNKGPMQHGRTSPSSPKTATDGKLDDLDNYSRRLQKDEARRRATGRASDPQHDW